MAGALPVFTAISAAVLLILAVPAFWPDYLSRAGSADNYTHAHALLGLLWLLLLIVQPLVVRARKLRIHRKLGRLGVVVGGGFLVSSILLTHHRLNAMDVEVFASDGFGFYLPLVMAALFGGALLLGVAWRRTMPLHGRYMACTALALVDPVIARLLYFHGPSLTIPWLRQLPAFTIIAVALAAMWRSLPPSQKGRRAFAVFAVAVIAALLCYFATPYSTTWVQWLEWFRALPLT